MNKLVDFDLAIAVCNILFKEKLDDNKEKDSQEDSEENS
jgi:hypothetical protein